jgi:hypothetical protein
MIREFEKQNKKAFSNCTQLIGEYVSNRVKFTTDLRTIFF